VNKCIFYGAGDYAKDHFEDYLREHEPICFCDRRAVEGMELCGLPVLPPSACLEKYPDAPILITVNPLETKPLVQEYLKCELGIPAKRIINWTGYDRSLSCGFLESSAYFHENKCHMCCSPFMAERVPEAYFKANDTPQQKVDIFVNLRDSVRKALRTGEQCACSDCPEIKEMWCLKEPQITFIVPMFYNICNLKCIYCNHIKNINNPDISKPSEFDDIGFWPIFLELRSRKFINRDILVQLAKGEITVHPKRKEILSSLNGFKTQILSNLVLWDEALEQHLSLGNSKVLCSVDAGTRETYASIKGADYFHQVCENLKRVVKLSKLELKYIFMAGINDNDKDVEGFIRLAAEIRPNSVMLSRDYRDLSPLGDRVLDSMAKIITAMNNLAIKATTLGGNLSKNENERLALFLVEHCGSS